MVPEEAGSPMAILMGSSPNVDAAKTLAMTGNNASLIADEAPSKVRKPYTITKQRERWTDDEHQKFVEALRLHGRAWRRIEEHIGTKTAVQIRSHAQKFFSKLEKEASTGTSSISGSSVDVEIPPPRPKRKPSHPYPRKAGGALCSGTPSSEEENKSSGAVCSAFTPCAKGCDGTNICKLSEAAHDDNGPSSSLRLFGKTVTVMGSDSSPVLQETESMSSPTSQISIEPEAMSRSSLFSSDADDVTRCKKSKFVCPFQGAHSSDPSFRARFFGTKHKSEASNNSQGLVEGSVGTSKKTHERSSSTGLANVSHDFSFGSQVLQGNNSLSGPSCCGLFFPPWNPCYAFPTSSFPAGIIPTLWQGPRPQGEEEDVSAAAAVAVASISQAMHGALSTPNEHSNTSMVYCPVAVVAAPKQKLSSCQRDGGNLKQIISQHKITDAITIRNLEASHNLVACKHEHCHDVTYRGRLSYCVAECEFQDSKHPERACNEDDKTSKEECKAQNASMANGNAERNGNCARDNYVSKGDRISQCAYPEPRGRITGGQLDIPIDISQDCCTSMVVEDVFPSTEAPLSAESLLMSERVSHAENNILTGKHVTMKKTGGLALSSRYSGVGFVPYKKSLAIVES